MLKDEKQSKNNNNICDLCETRNSEMATEEGINFHCECLVFSYSSNLSSWQFKCMTCHKTYTTLINFKHYQKKCQKNDEKIKKGKIFKTQK